GVFGVSAIAPTCPGVEGVGAGAAFAGAAGCAGVFGRGAGAAAARGGGAAGRGELALPPSVPMRTEHAAGTRRRTTPPSLTLIGPCSFPFDSRSTTEPRMVFEFGENLVGETSSW